MVARALSYLRRIYPNASNSLAAVWRLFPTSGFITALHISICVAAPALVVSYGLLNGKILDSLFNADMLLPADHVWSVLHHKGGWSSFQMPRIPSYVPDLTVYHSMTALFGNWRGAALGYALVSVAALILLGSGLVRRLYGTNYLAATTVVAAAVTLTLLIEAVNLQIDNETGREYITILLPIIHSGSLLLTLGGACLMPLQDVPSSRWRMAGMALLAFLGVQSDLLFMFTFVMPWCLAQLLTSRQWQMRAQVGTLFAAGLAGHFSLIHVFMQKSPAISSKRLADGLISIGHDLTHPSLNTLTLSLGVAASLIMLRKMTAKRAQCVFILASMWLPFLGFLTVYRDAGSYRYLQTLMWLPIFIITAPLAKVQGLTALRNIAGIATLSGLVLAMLNHSVPKVLSWHTPLQTCLSQLARQNLIHAGLSDYWLARTTVVSSDFTLQIEPVKSDGRFNIWGNDPYWFTHAFTGSAAPLYDFVLSRDLDEAEITGRFGRPDRIYTCPGRAKAPGSDVWVYDRPGGLKPTL